ncbi:WD repeat domain-containing protein 83 [Blattella germanica]|nr:WD repeat domain-containing protein 83 [Blattella germanica]
MSQNEFALQCLKTIDCKQGAVRSVRFNVDGSYCLTCGADKKLKLWNPHKALPLKTYSGHGSEVLNACSSCDNSQIVSCGRDKLVIMWDVSSGAPLRRFRGHSSQVTCVRYNEESTVAISGSHDNTVMCWDVRSRNNTPIQVMRDAKDSVTSLEVAGNEIVTGSVDGKVRRYDIRANKLFSDFIGEAITCVNLTRDSQCILVSSADSMVRLLDKDSGELLGEYSGHRTDDFCIQSCVDHKDHHVISGSIDGDIWCWDLVQGSIASKFTHEKGHAVHSVSFHPSQAYLLSAGHGTIKLWGISENDEN